MTTEHKPHSGRITDWTWQVGTVRSAIDTLTAVSHREEVDDAELHENSLNAYAALDWLAAEHERLEEQLEACEADRNSLSKSADYLQEQFGVLQEKARRFLVATGGPPEKIEDVGKARRELVDALHASYPATELPDPPGAGWQEGSPVVQASEVDFPASAKTETRKMSGNAGQQP